MKSARKIAKGTSVLRAGSPRVRRGLATGSPRGQNVAHWHGRFGGANRVAGAALWQPEVQISWQAQHFVPAQGQVQISGQAEYFRKAEYRFRGRRSTFARSSDG